MTRPLVDLLSAAYSREKPNVRALSCMDMPKRVSICAFNMTQKNAHHVCAIEITTPESILNRLVYFTI